MMEDRDNFTFEEIRVTATCAIYNESKDVTTNAELICYCTLQISENTLHLMK